MDGWSGRTSLTEYAAGTTTGSRRTVNEDAFGVFEERHVFVVADGCGGVMASGRSAANRTVASFAHPPLDGDPGLPGADPLALAVLAANAEVFKAGQIQEDLMGRGAAVCAVRVSPGWVSIVHVGDCRVGRYREGRLEWRTEDHSLLSELRKSGGSPQEVAQVAENHPTVVTRAVGVTQSLAVDLTYQPALPGDLYLLCSDGLARHVAQARIAEVLGAGTRSLGERCTALLDASESAGGHDNATVILLQLRS